MKNIVFFIVLAIFLTIFPTPGLSQIESMLDQHQIAVLTDRIVQEGKKRIAVVDFTDLQGNVTELGRFLAEEYSVAFVGAGKGIVVIDRVHLKSILSEHKLALTGVIDPKTARQLGRIAGVDALLTGSTTPFGDSIRVSVKVLDTESAMIIAASSGNIAKTSAINELLARGIETSQAFIQRSPSATKTFYSSKSKGYGVVEDSYIRVVVLNVRKSGNRFANIQLEYQNKTDKEIKLNFGYGYAAILVDDIGNKSQIHHSQLPDSIIPPKGRKGLGLGFEFKTGIKLGDNFNLTLLHRSNPPGSISFTDLKTK